jgi:hypothetical protein
MCPASRTPPSSCCGGQAMTTPSSSCCCCGCCGCCCCGCWPGYHVQLRQGHLILAFGRWGRIAATTFSAVYCCPEGNGHLVKKWTPSDRWIGQWPSPSETTKKHQKQTSRFVLQRFLVFVLSLSWQDYIMYTLLYIYLLHNIYIIAYIYSQNSVLESSSRQKVVSAPVNGSE